MRCAVRTVYYLASVPWFDPNSHILFPHPYPRSRFKKGLPLSCYPLRNGMVLPPGATLPPSVIVPPGMNIIIQPLQPTSGMTGSLAAEPHPLLAGGVPTTAVAAPPSPAVLI